MNKRRGPSAGMYIAIVLVLVVYFVWLVGRMASFANHGFRSLDAIAIGLGLGVLALAAGQLPGAIATRRARRRAARGE